MCMSRVFEVFDSRSFHTSARISSRLTTWPARLISTRSSSNSLFASCTSCRSTVTIRAPRSIRTPPASSTSGARRMEQGADAGQQFGQAERFGDVVVGARVEPDHEVDLVGTRGEHQHRHLGAAGAQAAAHLEPVHPGQAEIEDQQVHPIALGHVEGGGPVADDPHVVPLPLECAGKRIGDGRVVLGE